MYFPTKGKASTPQVARLAVQRARELGCKHIGIASTTGYTAEQFLAAIAPEKDLKLVVVTHHVGFREPGGDEMDGLMRSRLAEAGCDVLTTTHLFANIERAIANKFGGLYPGGIVSAALRCFGQGTKVCFEILGMAADAGLIPMDEEIVVAGGSGRGADTALVMKPAHAKSFFDTRVHEVICKPRAV